MPDNPEVSCECTESDITFEAVSASESLPATIRESIRNASVVFVPRSFREYESPVFPVQTTEYFRFISSQIERVELAVEDSDYVELALHGKATRLGTLLVTLLIAPVVANLTAEYLKHHLGSSFGSSEVHATIIVDDKKGLNSKSWSITYEGPATTFEQFVQDAIQKIPTQHSSNEKASHGHQKQHGSSHPAPAGTTPCK